MGWSSGSQLGEKVWDLVRKHVPEKDRLNLAEKIYDMFCDEDADDWSPDSNLCKDANVNQKEE